MRRAPWLLLLLSLGLVGAAPTPRASCRDVCQRAKSVDYQRCRSIPPTDRAGRLACFQNADRVLQKCLRDCR